MVKWTCEKCNLTTTRTWGDGVNKLDFLVTERDRLLNRIAKIEDEINETFDQIDEQRRKEEQLKTTREAVPRNRTKEVYSRKEAANFLGVDIQTVDKLVATGQLRYRKIGARNFYHILWLIGFLNDLSAADQPDIVA